LYLFFYISFLFISIFILYVNISISSTIYLQPCYLRQPVFKCTAKTSSYVLFCNGGGKGAHKDLHSRTGREEKKEKTQEKMKRRSRKRSSSAGSEKMEK